MRNEMVLLVAYKPTPESAPTSKIIRLRKSYINKKSLEKYKSTLNLTRFLREMLCEEKAIILHITILNPLEEFLLRL